MTALLLKSPAAASGAGLTNYKDPLLVPGVNFLFDLAGSLGYPKQAAPLTADPIVDISGNGNGSVNIAAGQTVAYSGRGFDFTGMTADPGIILAPVGDLASIWNAANDYFMVAFYAKLPASGDWNTDATLASMFCATASASGYSTPEVDLLTIAQNNGPNMTFRRQTNGAATVDTLNVSPALHYGSLTQVAFWRNPSGQGARLKSSGGTTVSTGSVSTNNTGDFSAKQARFGVCESFNDLVTKVPHRNAAKYRLYRGWIEDLSVSGRDPITVLDADYARTIARAVFS